MRAPGSGSEPATSGYENAALMIDQLGNYEAYDINEEINDMALINSSEM